MIITGAALLLASMAAAGGGGRFYTAKDASLRERIKESFARHLLSSHRRGSGPYAAAKPPLKVQREALGFKFATDLGCRNTGDDERFCALAGHKPWTDAEIESASEHLRSLSPDRLPRLFEAARRNGFDTLIRARAITHFDEAEGWRLLYYPNSLYTAGLAVVADPMFPLEHRGVKPTLHLLVHSADFVPSDGLFFPSLSVSDDFLRLTGFALAPEGHWTLPRMSDADRARYMELFRWKNAETMKAQRLSDPIERRRAYAAIAQRTEAFARPFGAPTFHALLNPYEALAEWATFVHFDEDKARAFDPRLTAWIKEHVLR